MVLSHHGNHHQEETAMTEKDNPEPDAQDEQDLEDVEGHRRVRVTDDEDDDVQGHVQPPRDLGIDR